MDVHHYETHVGNVQDPRGTMGPKWAPCGHAGSVRFKREIFIRLF